VRDVTDLDFDDVVLRADRPVVVDFWAPWCGPCHAVTPILERLSEEHESVEFVKLDIDSNPGTAARYGILSIPTVTVFSGGQPRETLVGARPRGHYERALASFV
jgi:thioredoxin 1